MGDDGATSAVDAAALIAIGLSHHTAPVGVRERMAMDEAGVRAELALLQSSELVREALVLSTCNRVELYAVPVEGRADSLRQYMAQRRVGTEALGPYLYAHSGPDAVRHLFRVAASLDSLVVGEPQILGQVKEAVRIATASGSLGAVLHRLTQRTLWVAKQVRTHTDIGRFNVGIGNAGVHLAKQIFSSLQGRRALLVGTGEMGREVAKAMVGMGVSELLVANRTFASAVEVAQEFGGTALPFDRIDDYLHRVDIVIAATGSQRPIIEARQVKAALKARRYSPLFLVDLSVPRNIDPGVEDLDQAYLFNIDDLRQVMERGREARQRASHEAEQIVERETGRFAARLADLAVNSAIGELVQRADGFRAHELHRSRRVLDTLTPEQRAAVEVMMKAYGKRMLGGPLAAIHGAVRRGEEETLRTLLAAFDVTLPSDAGDDG